MRHTANLLLLQFVVAVSIKSTDYSQDGEMIISPRCQRRMRSCGLFTQPTDDLGQYECMFNKRTCGYTCTLLCPKKENGQNMVLDTKRYGRETHVCSGGKWRRRDAPRTFCKAKWPVPEVLQNLHHVDELNYLVNALLNTSYFYLGMSSFYDRADVALPGFSKFMADLWSSDMAQARDVLQYVNRRGGYISLYDLPRPSSHEMLLLRLSNKAGLVGMEMALQTNKDVNEHVLLLQKIVAKPGKRNDPHLKHYLEDGLLSTKVETIKQIADHVNRLRGFSDEDYTVGEYVLDTELS